MLGFISLLWGLIIATPLVLIVTFVARQFEKNIERNLAVWCSVFPIVFLVNVAAGLRVVTMKTFLNNSEGFIFGYATTVASIIFYFLSKKEKEL